MWTFLLRPGMRLDEVTLAAPLLGLSALVTGKFQDAGPKPAGTTTRELSLGANGLTLCYGQNGLRYSLTVPLNARDGVPLQVDRVLSDGQTEKRERFSGLGFLDAEVPAAFAQLHELVRATIDRVLPSDVRALAQECVSACRDGLSAMTSQAASTDSAKDTEQPQPAGTDTVPAAGQAAQATGALAEGAAVDKQTDTDGTWHTVVVPRDNQADLSFAGQLIARVASAPRHGRGQVLSVYRTRAGRFVGVRTGYSTLPFETTRSSAVVACGLAELIPFFGYAPVAKALYSVLDLPCTEQVD